MPPFRFISHGLTHPGLVRQRNEDAFLDRPEAGLWAVADGMGGHEQGDYASGRIIGRLADFAPFADLEEYSDEVRRALSHVDVHLRARAKALGPQALIGSTVACLLVCGEEFAAVWAGDSRVYLLRDGALQRLSHDHSRVQELLDAGLLKPEEAALHPEVHVVTRAIGVARLHFGSRPGIIRAGDRFLLCTDGLTNVVADAEIASVLAATTPSEATRQLVDLVLARGAPDNVAVIVAAADPAG